MRLYLRRLSTSGFFRLNVTDPFRYERYPVLQLPQLGFRILGCGASIYKNNNVNNRSKFAESISREREKVDAYIPRS